MTSKSQQTLMRWLALLIAGWVVCLTNAVAASYTDSKLIVRINNLKTVLEFKETAAPAKLPQHSGLRYFTTPQGHVVAMANRLLVVVKGQDTLDTILALPQVLDHAPLAHLESSHIELLETADVTTALALLGPLSKMPGVISVQPDISQNITRQGGGRFLDWEHFDLAKAIGLREAWRYTQGQGVRIAIIDSGIDLLHKDLRGTKLVAGFDVERRSHRIPLKRRKRPTAPASQG